MIGRNLPARGGSLLLAIFVLACSEAGTVDAGAADAGSPDAPPRDAAMLDAAMRDAASRDAASPDAGRGDAGHADGGAFDAGGPDAGVAAGFRVELPGAPITDWVAARELVHRSCLFSISCGGPLSFDTLGMCIEARFRRLVDPSGLDAMGPDPVECAREATGCEEFVACATAGHDASYCASHEQQSCDGDVAVTCPIDGGAALVVADCGARGLRCEIGGSTSLCTTGEPCDRSGAWCQDGFVATCDWVTNTVHVSPCYLGSRCTISIASDGTPRGLCVWDGPPCESVGNTCDGETLHACEEAEGTRTDRVVDCAAAGLECHAAFGTCTSSGSECAAFSDVPSCGVGGVRACVNGERELIPCSLIGRSTCGAGPEGELGCTE